MHADRKKELEDNLQTWYNQKRVVLGMRSRDGEVRMEQIARARKRCVDSTR